MSIHGYQHYAPKEATKNVLMAAKKVLADYRAWERPMTVRQVFYRLVAEYGFDKTEGAYGSLVNYIARSRRAYMAEVIRQVEEEGQTNEEANDAAMANHMLIPFHWIRDERGKTHEVTSFEDVEDFTESLMNWIEHIQMDRREGQPELLELWCEAAGMVPLMREIAQPYGLRVSSGGGYDSVTAKHSLARRVATHFRKTRQTTTILHIGDFDPSGEGMYETLQDDVGEMVWQLLGRDALMVERIGLTEMQVISMEIETAPPKPLDSRRRNFVAKHPEIREHLGSDDITAQLEALTPDELDTLVRGAIEDRLDRSALLLVQDGEEALRDELYERYNLIQR